MNRYPILPLHDFASFVAEHQHDHAVDEEEIQQQRQQHEVVDSAAAAMAQEDGHHQDGPPRKKSKRKLNAEKALQEEEEMEIAVRVLRRCQDAILRTKKGGVVSRKFDPLLIQVFELQDAHDDMLERRWKHKKAQEKKSARTLELEAKRHYMDVIRREVRVRYEAQLQKECRRRLPAAKMDLIIAEVRRVLNVPDHVEISRKILDTNKNGKKKQPKKKAVGATAAAAPPSSKSEA